VYIHYNNKYGITAESMIMGKLRILLVEDDPQISKLITDYLSRHHFEVFTAISMSEALDLVRRRGLPSLALIDLGLPEGDLHGFEVSSKLKAIADIPIIFVTAITDSDTIVYGLERYGEDFISKPFALPVLKARIEAVLARMPHVPNEVIVRVDEHLSVDFGNARIILHGRIEGLTPTEASLLSVLLRHAGSVVENRLLLERVWPTQQMYTDTLRVHMFRLRQKLEADPRHPDYIRTATGVGYMFTVKPESELLEEVVEES
jgi:DNA-binding response OmpR family regulator